MSNSPEELNVSPESTVEIQKAAAERKEQLDNSTEKSPERDLKSVERTEAQARFEALESAVSVEDGSAEAKKPAEGAQFKRRGPISKKQKDISYKRTMEHVQAELSAPERVFSKVIHNKVVEKTSDAVGNTVARPNAILAGAVFAFILTLAVYVTAKTIGYALSGFESIAAFVIGWIVGVTYDYLRLLVTGKKS